MLPLNMRAWQLDSPRPIDEQPLRFVERPVPAPASGDLLVEVSACGVCRTDLHVTEGDLDLHRPGITPGHEIVGRVVAVGNGVDSSRVGQRVGGAWLRATCGACRWCRRGRENLCPASRYTGWDEDGGYAEFTIIPDAFAYSLPKGVGDVEAAPLLCAGVIGYRALNRAKVPTGGTLGLYGFGASAHITMQVALAMGAECHVLTRGESARALALELGAASVGDAYDAPPTRLDSAIVFAPAGELVPSALEALDRGGTLALAGIHMSAIPALHYQRHLFLERSLRSVTSNTRADAEELLALSARLPLRLATSTYPLDAADRALADLAGGRVTGAAVLTTNGR
jgi:propanol-preferring alcohol dehydrogenase